MPEPDLGRSQRLFDEMLQDASGAREAAGAAPVLPRLRLTLPSASAPLTIKRKAASQVPLPAAQLLPEILRQVDEARRKRSAARVHALALASAKAAEALPVEAPPPAKAPEAPAGP